MIDGDQRFAKQHRTAQPHEPLVKHEAVAARLSNSPRKLFLRVDCSIDITTSDDRVNHSVAVRARGFSESVESVQVRRSCAAQPPTRKSSPHVTVSRCEKSKEKSLPSISPFRYSIRKMMGS